MQQRFRPVSYDDCMEYMREGTAVRTVKGVRSRTAVSFFSPKLVRSAVSASSICPGESCPMYSFKRQRSMVLTCSRRMVESHFKPLSSLVTGTWVGSLALVVLLVMAATITVGL